MKRVYGYIPDLPDFRDLKFVPKIKPLRLPSSVDLTSSMPPVVDQGQLGSCTANAIASAYQFEQIKQKETSFAPSRLFIYYNERVMEGTVKTDAGAMIRDGVKSVAQKGVCPETQWKYVVSKFAAKPPTSCYATALNNQALQYSRLLQTLTDMKSCIAEGFPIILGFSVYESFESATVSKTGIVPLPKAGESMLGGHAVLAVGYNDSKKRFICRNSWGTSWGMKGYFTIPYSYLLNSDLASDFWKITLVE